MSRELSENEVAAALSGLDGWESESHELVKTYKFPTFRAAIAFIVRISFEADEMNHHPELRNVYNRVRVALCTHDAGSVVTEKDVTLAEKIEKIASSSMAEAG